MGRVMRLKAGIGILGGLSVAIAVFFGAPWEDLPRLMFQCLVPFAWLLMVTDETAEKPYRLTRGILGLMAAFLVLYAFPVHGTQTMLASLLPAVMLAVLLNDAVRHPGIQLFLNRHLPGAFLKEPVIAAMAYTLMLAMLGIQTVPLLRHYQSLEALNLRGASLVRTDHESAQLLRWVVGEVDKCPAFYSLPSLPSLYFWSGQRAPTGMISNNTFGLLSPEQQRHAIADLDRYNELCILTIPALLEFFDRVSYVPDPRSYSTSRGISPRLHQRGPFMCCIGTGETSSPPACSQFSSEHPDAAFLGNDFVSVQEFWFQGDELRRKPGILREISWMMMSGAFSSICRRIHSKSRLW